MSGRDTALAGASGALFGLVGAWQYYRWAALRRAGHSQWPVWQTLFWLVLTNAVCGSRWMVFWHGKRHGATVHATATYVVAPVPLPASALLLLGGLGGLAFMRKRKQKAA